MAPEVRVQLSFEISRSFRDLLEAGVRSRAGKGRARTRREAADTAPRA